MPEYANRPPWKITDALAPLSVRQLIDNGWGIRVECEACNHRVTWSGEDISVGLGRLRNEQMIDVAPRLRCARCRSRYTLVSLEVEPK